MVVKQQTCCLQLNLVVVLQCYLITRDVTEPANICICWMWISCSKSIRCGFVVRSKLPTIIATVIQLSYLKLNRYRVLTSEFSLVLLYSLELLLYHDFEVLLS